MIYLNNKNGEVNKNYYATLVIEEDENEVYLSKVKDGKESIDYNTSNNNRRNKKGKYINIKNKNNKKVKDIKYENYLQLMQKKISFLRLLNSSIIL